MQALLPHSQTTGTTRARMRFLVIGAGGLGCPALLGLQAGGAHRITIVDDDHVDPSNLPRQVLFSGADVGVAKVDAARQALLGRSTADVTSVVTTRRQRLRPEDLDGLLEDITGQNSGGVGSGAMGSGVVLECSDSPTLKFAVHDACVRRGVGVVIGGVVGWHGQAMAVDPRRPDTACYRCLFEAPPPPELAPACSSVGVAGPVAGTIGHAMAALAIGLARGSDLPGGSPAGVCLHFDLLRGSVRRLAPRPRPNCVTCSTTQEN